MVYKIYVDGHFVGECDVDIAEDAIFLHSPVYREPRRSYEGSIAATVRDIEIEALKAAEAAAYERLLYRARPDWPPLMNEPGRATTGVRSAREMARGPPVNNFLKKDGKIFGALIIINVYLVKFTTMARLKFVTSREKVAIVDNVISIVNQTLTHVLIGKKWYELKTDASGTTYIEKNGGIWSIPIEDRNNRSWGTWAKNS